MLTNEVTLVEDSHLQNECALTIRKETNIPITIYCHSFPYLVCRARELGSDGILVDGDFTNLPAHAFLEAEFSNKVNGESRRFRLPVYIDGIKSGVANLLFAFPGESGMELMTATG